jgi:hypothetical protein
VKIIKKFLEKIIPIITSIDKKIINISFSAASLSFKIFKKNFNYFKINTEITMKDENFLRSSYYGGRCEVVGNPENSEIVKYYDYSGMYGQCMSEKFHVGDGEYKINCDYNEPGFHHIIYESNLELPILPSHGENNKLMFMNGVREGIF